MKKRSKNILGNILIGIGVLCILSSLIFYVFHYIQIEQRKKEIQVQKEMFMKKNKEKLIQAQRTKIKLENDAKLLTEVGMALDASKAPKCGKSVLKSFDTEQENGAIAFIDIKKIDVSAPVFSGASAYELSLGAGVVRTTDKPSKELNTCSVLAGHRGGRNAELNFFRANELVVGDELTVLIPSYELFYKVVEKKVVKDDDWSQFTREKDKNKLILMTCHPYPVNVDRLLIICELVDTKKY